MINHCDIKQCLVGLTCLLAAATLGCEKETPVPAQPKVVVKKIAVAQKALKKAKTVAKAAKAKTVAPAPAKRAVAPPAAGTPAVSAPAAKPTPAPIAPGTTPPVAKKASALGQLAMMSRPRFYNPEGRINPFTPLFQKKPEVEKKPKRDKRERRIPQTPLEKVALGQLKLVAIMQMQSGPRALVEESSGKGYVVRMGTYMGLNSGRVIDIRGGRVIVEEAVENLLGDIEVKKQELKLQKPLGE
jgi:type IV pilus assembly protein PilP